MHVKWYNRKGFIILLHISCWIVLFLLPYLLRPSFDPASKAKIFETYRHQILYLIFINRFIWVGLFYLNAGFFIPRLIYKRNYWAYVALIVSIVGALFLIDWGIYSILLKGLPYFPKNFFSFNLFPIFFVLACSTAFKMVKDRIEQDRLQKERENENLKTELSLLRSQVSPHFMFNIMNNMVALARKKSDILEPSLIKLSALLRYMLYETDEKVPLQKEIEYLQSYIDLQKQRLSNNVKIKACLEKVDAPYEIEPMLLIPFVENAFKHGTAGIQTCEVTVALRMEGRKLHLHVVNSIPFRAKARVSTGVGLDNTRQRLEMLYAGTYQLTIQPSPDRYVVDLTLPLRCFTDESWDSSSTEETVCPDNAVNIPTHDNQRPNGMVGQSDHPAQIHL